MEELKSLVKRKTVIRMLDGTVLRGTVETAGNDQLIKTVSDKLFGDSERLYFESSNGQQSGMIATNSLKVIYLGAETDAELQEGLRFFDSAPVPNFLWARVAFHDGEVIEGMIPNDWSAFCAPLIQLQLPGERLGQKCILIPRTSVGQLQVITARH
ncbi:MAG TPA: hypothetical protein VME86_05905 [Acidobacteriaceae bacterium]|nr:hypothetical protein [Acidobacteriaceae bacterium]